MHFLVLVWCYKSIGDGEQTFWRYWPPECCIKHCYDKRTSYGCLCKKCGLEEEWSSDNPVSHILYKWSDVQYANTWFRNISDQHQWPESPLIKQISSSFLHCYSGLWAFCQAVIILTYVLANTICSFDELDPWHIIHILGFITPNICT